jgi:hypothetical protein
MNACIISSMYTIPELYLMPIYKLLVSDAEKYVFLSIISQKYPNHMYVSNRDKLLTPVFGKERIDVLAKFESNTPFTPEIIDVCTTTDANNCRLNYVKPIDSNIISEISEPKDNYEFISPQLSELVLTGDTAINDKQLSSVITLIITIKSFG